jgi:hypothetical protein
MSLVVNKLIQWLHDEAKPTTERVLYIDQSGDVATINVECKTAVPCWHKYDDISFALETRNAVLLEMDDFAPPALSETEFNTEKYQHVKEHRDKAYERIAPLINGENEVLILFPHERARLIAQQVAATGVSRQTLYLDIRRWWQGGQTPNALSGRHYLCGTRKDGKSREVSKKLGRPSIITRNDKEKRPTGVNIDEKWRDIIIKGGERFYENRDQKSWAKAYRATLRFYCPKDFKVENGIKKIVLPDANKNEVFTLGQFRYHYFIHLTRNLRRALTKRLGTQRYNLRHRELKGNAKDQAPGPGSLYQIDATLADVYLRSKLRPSKIIGRPVFYAVMDVFSRMIVGIAVRLEGEGWQGVRLALENVIADKVAFCTEYGVKITEDMWPRCYLPEHLTGDRGPLEGKNGDNIPKALHTRLSNTAPYRADWKGSIEQFFNFLNLILIHALPGAVDPYHERGDKDYRLDAVLDIHEFTELIIDAVLFHNLKRRLNDYPLDADMIADGVQPYPAELYNWGIENRSGSLREANQETVRANLLPEGEATVTEYGIKFGPCLYTCALSEKEGWREKAREFGRWSVRVAYHPRTTKILYLRPGGGKPSIPCGLIDPKSAYAGCDWREVNDYVEESKVKKSYATSSGMQDISDLEATIQQKVKKAEKNKREDLNAAKKMSKRSRTESIRENRNSEIEDMQRDDVNKFLKGNTSGKTARLKTSTGSHQIENFDDKPVPLPQIVNLQEIRKRRMNSGQD